MNNPEKKKREYMNQDELVEDFEKTYSKPKLRKWLQGIANRNKDLVDLFILGQPKNPYYRPKDNRPITKWDNEYFALVNWIIPMKKYKYKEVSWEHYCNSKNVKRSSIIPFVRTNGLKYWLLGTFRDYDNNNPILSDFGGKCEEEDRKDECPSLKCALRELGEESKDLLNIPVKNAINEGNYTIFEGTYENEKIYFIIVELEYENVRNIPENFKNKKWDKEFLGSLNFYRQRDIQTDIYKTAKNLTDFIDYLYKTGQ